MKAFLGNKNLKGFIGSKPLFKGFLGSKVIYASEEYPFVDGVLADGLTLSGFTISDNTLAYTLSQSGDSDGQPAPKTENIMISGIDLTGYDYLDFSAVADSNSWWGEATYIKFGIDTADNTLFSYAGYKDAEEEPVSYSERIDVSAYEGVHNLVFECQVHASTTSSGYVSRMELNIDTIKLHNEEGEG